MVSPKDLDLVSDPAVANYTRGTGPQPIDSKLVVTGVPVQSGPTPPLTFGSIGNLAYTALLYELHDIGDTSGSASNIVPNWFGVALPNNFDLSSDVYVILYFHPTPGQTGAGYSDADYPAKSGDNGTDWKELYAYVDRLGGQMAGAIQSGAPANRVVIFPFLTSAQYTLPTREWFNIIHDILKDINTNYVEGICTRPKKMIVATISNGGIYMNHFLDDTLSDQNNNINNNDSYIVEVWDFDSDIATTQVDPHEKPLRAYWQNQVPQNSARATYVYLPAASWTANFPNPPPDEKPPLPPNPSNNNPSSPRDSSFTLYHHYIRDTMFLDAVFNIENDNPNP